MKRIAILIAPALLAGCAGPQQVHLNTGRPGDKSGPVVDSYMVGYIYTNQHLTTPDDLLFHVTDPDPSVNYWALFGPDPSTGTPATGGRCNSRTTFSIDSGYAMFRGVQPIGTDGIEDTSADGTTFIIQSSGKYNRRSYLVDNPTGKPVHVYLTGTSPANGKTLTKVGTYIEVLYDAADLPYLSDEQQTDAKKDTRDFVAAIKAKAVNLKFWP